MSDAMNQARAQVESIVEMVAALQCDFDRLEELREARADSGFPSRVLAKNPDHSGGWWEDEFPDEAAELAELEAAAGECADADEARQRIEEDALSVEVRSGWQTPGEDLQPEEFRIVLCTGGPHVEIVGGLNRHNEPESVRILYHNWGESGELFDFDRDAVLAYAACFFFDTFER